MNLYLRPSATAPLTRRGLLAGVGLTAAALGGLTACGTDDGSSAAAGSSPGPVTAPVGDIPVGGGTIFPEAQTVITQPTEGQFRAFSSICTHARCPLSGVTETINCDCHGSRFSLTDGSVVAGPALDPLPAKTVTVAGNDVSVSA